MTGASVSNTAVRQNRIARGMSYSSLEYDMMGSPDPYVNLSTQLNDYTHVYAMLLLPRQGIRGVGIVLDFEPLEYRLLGLVVSPVQEHGSDERL